MVRSFNIFIIVCFVILLWSCGETTFPKPYGYFRVDLPAHTYRTIDTLGLPYQFDLSKNATLIERKSAGEKYWIDIFYSALDANLYCSYKAVNGNLIALTEDSRKIVYKHSIRADGITEKVFENPGKNVHGILYDLSGNTASSIQFVLTDSTHHFFRAALYFNSVPNKDSIAPMAEYVRQDVLRMIESFEWKK